MKHLFIVNPIAGGKDKSAEVRAKVESAFRTRADSYEVYVTKAPMDVVDKIRREAASGEELRVYACGGDGTFNECVNGAAGLANVAAAPFPTGTGNDFCRMFGAEKDACCCLDPVVKFSALCILLVAVQCGEKAATARCARSTAMDSSY